MILDSTKAYKSKNRTIIIIISGKDLRKRNVFRSVVWCRSRSLSFEGDSDFG